MTTREDFENKIRAQVMGIANYRWISFDVISETIKACAAHYEDERNELQVQLNSLATENAKLTSDKYPFIHLRIDASAAEIEGALKTKLIDLGWSPPDKRNALLALIAEKDKALREMIEMYVDDANDADPEESVGSFAQQALSLTHDSVRLVEAAKVGRLVNSVCLDSSGCEKRWDYLPIGTKLYTIVKGEAG